jgi:anaerobic ribonucleoside-triphosphate reductase
MLNCTSQNEKQVFLQDSERQKCEVYTRVMGYIRPQSEFNIGKQQECKERKCFKLVD